MKQDFSRHPARVHLGEVVEKADDVARAGKQTGKSLEQSKAVGKLDDFSSEWKELQKSFPDSELDQSVIDDITKIKVDVENGEFRPNPRGYLNSEYIRKHNILFDDGVAAFTKDTSNLERFGQFGRDDGAFVFPKNVANAMVKEADGNPRVLEKLLGLDEGSLGKHPIMIEPEKVKNLRIPSGNEGGAKDNLFWRPGGKTYPGGVPEAVIDPVSTDKLRITELWK